MPLPEHYFKVAHENTTVADLHSFAQHHHHLVRLRVAEHLLSCHQIFSDLSSDQHPEVRAAVAENPNTPANVLEKLARDPHPDVRYSMAENAQLPIEILRMLTEDDNPYVSQRAARTLRQVEGSSNTASHPNRGGNGTQRAAN